MAVADPNITPSKGLRFSSVPINMDLWVSIQPATRADEDHDRTAGRSLPPSQGRGGAARPQAQGRDRRGTAARARSTPRNAGAPDACPAREPPPRRREL